MLSQVTIPPIIFLGKELATVDTVKDLGVTLDQCLTFNNYVNSLTSDLMKKLAMISRIKHLLDKTTLFIAINSLVFSKLYYYSSVWAGTSKSNIAKLQLVQNFAERLLSDKRKFDHINPTLRKLKLLPVSDILYMRDTVQMYKCVNGLGPHYLTAMIRKRSDIHSYNTRQNRDQQLPRCRTALAQNAFDHRGVKVWNSIPEEIRNSKAVQAFKSSLKRELLKSFLSSK